MSTRENPDDDRLTDQLLAEWSDRLQDLANSCWFIRVCAIKALERLPKLLEDRLPEILRTCTNARDVNSVTEAIEEELHL